MNIDDYTWKERDYEWFIKQIGKRIEYASLALIRQDNKKYLIPKDVIHGENDAEYHAKLAAEWGYYYRLAKS